MHSPVSKFIASEAKGVWHAKTTSLILDASEDGPVLPDFLDPNALNSLGHKYITEVFDDLKHRLISLEIIATGFELGIPWIGLLRSCPRLKNR